jgi:ketosteroid isomerase-like protein
VGLYLPAEGNETVTIKDPLAVFRAYDAALEAGNMVALVDVLADDIVWHQPGRHRLSGDRRGRVAVLQLFQELGDASSGTFRVQTRNIMVNGSMVAASVRFSGQRGNRSIDMDGVDFYRVVGNLITEAWLFSADQDEEDTFWS